MKRVLVSGGFGFLGSHLLELLLQDEEWHITVVDNLTTNPLPLEFLLNALEAGGRIESEIMSVQDYIHGTTSESFDTVFHLASVVGPAGVLEHAGKIAKSVIDDAIALARMCLRDQTKLLFVSTSEVYGGGREGLCSEDMPRIVSSTVSARLEYAVGKLAAEVSLINLSRTSGLDVRIVRPFNVSGPRQSGRGGFVLPRFIGQAMANQDITVFGKGDQLRAFTHAQDVASGIIAASVRGTSGETYNIGNPKNKCSILELAQEVVRITGASSRVVFVDPKEIYGEHFQEANDKFPDSTKAERELGWVPIHSRESTIQSTYDFMRSLPQPLLHEIRGF